MRGGIVISFFRVVVGDDRRDCHFLFWVGKEMRGGIVSFSGEGKDHCFLWWRR